MSETTSDLSYADTLWKAADALRGQVDAAEYIKREFKKPVTAFIAGSTAPKGKRMGHAGAIITGGKETAEAKFDALRAAGCSIAKSPADLGTTLAASLKR